MANRKPLYDELFTGTGAVCMSIVNTQELGAEIASHLKIGSVVSLEGPLGAGKTQLTKGIVAALGCPDEASSPSFALMHEYPGGRIPVFHYDFYRMDDESELTTAGYDDCLAEGVTLVEWGNKFPQALPPGTLRLRLEVQPDNSRRVIGTIVV